MSFSQVLPMPSGQFGTGSEFFLPAGYTSSQMYGNMSEMPQQALQFSEQQPSTLSSLLLTHSPTYGRGASRNSMSASRTPPGRDRTPIRHHRASESRARSGSRPDAVLQALATELEQQQNSFSSLPHRHAPKTPPAYQTPEFLVPVSSAAYNSQSSYYSTQIPQPLSHYETETGAYENDPGQSAYYALSRSGSLHATGTLNPQDALYLPNILSSHTTSLPSLASTIPSFPPTSAALESSSGDSFHVLASRQRPQCWDHGCNGRQFSTFSNLLRHQREKSGSAMKSICPQCGTEFTRTTARNGHMYGGKCKGKPEPGQSDSDHGGSSDSNAEAEELGPEL